jgi:hypothetical protein
MAEQPKTKIPEVTEIPGAKHPEGCLQINDTQMCWGTARADVNTGATNARMFNFHFPRAFDAPPVVTISVNTSTSGWIYGVYNYTLTATDYKGDLASIPSNLGANPVDISYIAIGRRLME